MSSSVAVLLGLVLLAVILIYWRISDIVAIQRKQLLILTALLDSQRMNEAERAGFVKRSLDAIEASK